MKIKLGAPKLVYGIGITDTDYVVKKWETLGYVNGVRKRKLVWECPYYRAWTGMLRRCYSTEYQERNPTYRGCSVSEEWLTFSVFKSWMENQDWKGLQLDKDILFNGNKVYSDETCVFVTSVVNSFTMDNGNNRGGWLIGVCWDRGASKFVSRCRNPFTKKQEYLGLFDCEQEAHQAWQVRKLELATLLAEEQTDARVAKALIERYIDYTKLGNCTHEQRSEL